MSDEINTSTRSSVKESSAVKPPILTNRKPADTLAEIRGQIKDLQAREDYIKRMIVSGRMSPDGDDFYVIVSQRKQSRLDRDKLKTELGDDLSRFMSEVEFSVCTVKAQPDV